MLLLYAIHHPHPAKVEQLVQRMREFGALVEQQPGMAFVSPAPFRDSVNGTLVTLVVWQSRAAFEAAWPRLAEHAPSEEWEIAPREVHVCDELA